MIDLTPLDVRKKHEDFRRILRGYDPEEVDTFLQLVAERLEELVKETLTLRERTDRLQEQVTSQQGREKAVQEALVTAQELRDDIRTRAQEDADEVRSRAQEDVEELRTRTEREISELKGRAEQEVAQGIKEALAEAEKIVAEAKRQHEERLQALEELERKRVLFLKSFRSLLERQLDVVQIEEGRPELAEVLDGGADEAPQSGGPQIVPDEIPDDEARTEDASGDEAEIDTSPMTDAIPDPSAEAAADPTIEKIAIDEPRAEGTASHRAAARWEMAEPATEVASPEAAPAETEATATPSAESAAGASSKASGSPKGKKKARNGGPEVEVVAEEEAADIRPLEEGDEIDPEEDPKLWLSTLVERELTGDNEQDEGKWS